MRKLNKINNNNSKSNNSNSSNYNESKNFNESKNHDQIHYENNNGNDMIIRIIVIF